MSSRIPRFSRGRGLLFPPWSRSAQAATTDGRVLNSRQPLSRNRRQLPLKPPQRLQQLPVRTRLGLQPKNIPKMFRNSRRHFIALNAPTQNLLQRSSRPSHNPTRHNQIKKPQIGGHIQHKKKKKKKTTTINRTKKTTTYPPHTPH